MTFEEKEVLAMRALREIGACCTWQIRISSEGCKIEIAGLPVLMENFDPANTGTATFFESDKSVDEAEAILRAADAWEQRCGGPTSAPPPEEKRRHWWPEFKDWPRDPATGRRI